MKKRSKITLFLILGGLMAASCSLLLSSQERKLVGKWHEKSQVTEDNVILYIEDWDEYKDNKTESSFGKITWQINIGEDGYNYIVFISANYKTEGKWEIEGDNLISKSDVVDFSDMKITSNIKSLEFKEAAVKEFKDTMSDLFSETRDEWLKKDTTEIVLLDEKEFKYKVDGTIYTMQRVK